MDGCVYAHECSVRYRLCFCAFHEIWECGIEISKMLLIDDVI